MSSKRPGVRLCMENDTPGPRDECPNALHDYPLPSGYLDEHRVASERISNSWKQKKCPDCKIYGWIKGV